MAGPPLALRQDLGIGLFGAAAGVLFTLSTAGFVQPLLFDVSASDPILLAVVAAIVFFVALGASYAPSRRMRRLDPIVALRVE